MSFNNPEQSLFISGEEQASLVLNSSLLHFSSGALRAEVTAHQHNPSPPPLRWKVEQHPKFTILAFVTSPDVNTQRLQQGEGGDLVSFKKENFSLDALSSSLKALKKENSHAFDFLWSKGNPNFSFDKTAITLFSSCFDQLSDLKNQFLREEIDKKTKKPKIVQSTPLIVTGHSVGGSIASLFSLLLLDSISQPQDKLPICITFGSPFLGDKDLQGAISQYSKWNSCFVHVVAIMDPVLKLFVPQPTPQPFGTFGSFGSPSPTTTTQQQHQPFGAYFLCSETGYTCVEDSVIVSELLVTMGSESIRNQILRQEFSMEHYGSLVQHLSSKVFVKEDPKLDSSVTHPLRAGIILQLEAIGDKEQAKQDIIRKLVDREITLLHKKMAMNPLKKLNDVKTKMAYLEWYKKQCKAKEVGYYDSYKNLSTYSDREVTKHKKFLNQYWEKQVEDAEKKPQKEGARIRSTWLFAGINYRRMVEPLDIAEYYKVKSNRDYVNCKRSKHYKLLEEWAKEEAGETTQPPSDKKKQNVAELLTEDSCFWAKVEEALVACKSYKESPTKQASQDYLMDFDKRVMDEIDKYALSPEIFLEQSSFMRWWKEYEAIIGGYNSRLVRFMKNGMYNQYASGNYSPFY